MADWRTDLLKALKAPVTKQNLSFLGGWQRWEGGHTNNDARYNWLNTTQAAPGATGSINSVGVKAFDSYQSGVGATAATLQNGRYGDIVAALRRGDPYAAKPVAGLSTWLSGSSTSAAGQRYAEKVLGTKVGTQVVQAFNDGPAGVVANPNPQAQLQLRQAAALTMLQQAGNSVDGKGADPSALMGLAVARRQLDDANRQYQASEANARQYGGTTSTAAVGPQLEGGSEVMNKILSVANAQIGKPYVWGAETPDEGGFDCSGLLDYAFKQAGVRLPGRLTTYTAAKMGVSVKGKPYKPGDWIITNGGKHMVMYVGNGQVIAAPRRGEVVQYQPVSRFDGSVVDVRRVLK